MKSYRYVLAVMLTLGLWAVPTTGTAQPVLEQLRFDPSRVCPRDTFRWGVSYRGIPGGLAAMKAVVIEALWEGPGEQTFRSQLTPTRDDFRSNTTEQGRFESRLMHAGPPRKMPAPSLLPRASPHHPRQRRRPMSCAAAECPASFQ